MGNLFGNEGLDGVCGVGEEVMRMTADLPPTDGQREED